MRYLYTNANGEEISLRVDREEEGVIHLVEATEEVVISAQQLYDDLANEISMGGCHFGTAYDVMTDRYMREHRNVSWESLTKPLRLKLVSYLEELRADSGDNEDDAFYNDGKPWTLKDIYI